LIQGFFWQFVALITSIQKHGRDHQVRLFRF
jgi:hypothetical protein